MSIEKIDNTFYEETSIRLANTSYLKTFNLLYDNDNKVKFLNIFKSFILNQEQLNKYLYEIYVVDNNDWFDNIAFRYYGTPYLWWLIALCNNINNPFEELEIGMKLVILKEHYLYLILKEMTAINRL